MKPDIYIVDMPSSQLYCYFTKCVSLYLRWVSASTLLEKPRSKCHVTPFQTFLNKKKLKDITSNKVPFFPSLQVRNIYSLLQNMPYGVGKKYIFCHLSRQPITYIEKNILKGVFLFLLSIGLPSNYYFFPIRLQKRHLFLKRIGR